ncbi:hypothetical protein HMPREF9594_00002 [Cutibacterium acnes HL005PA1]|jgi:hypothetical protein|nr:hypothetical protein HMPREF9594_00002 [Cutibacterium acnes HL005PA1]
MLLGGPECGSQGFPAFTTAGLVVGVGVLGCEAGCAGGGFCAAAELVVDELGAVVFAGQAAFMGVVVGEGVSGLVDEQSQGVVLVVGAWHVEAEATVPAVHGVEEGVEVCGLPVFVDAQGGEGVAQSADVMVSHQPGQVLVEEGCEFLQPQGFLLWCCWPSHAPARALVTI